MPTFNRCHHTFPNAKSCGSPALRGERFCFYHHPTRRAPTRVKASRMPFDLPPVTCAEDAQIILSEVIRRLADTTLDFQRAALILQTVQAARANLRFLPAYPAQEFHDDSPSTSLQTSPDFSDLSGLLADLSPHPTPPNRGL